MKLRRKKVKVPHVAADLEANNTKGVRLQEMCEGIQWWKGQDPIVISGVSCRFPDSDNMEEFQQNLMNKVDMVTEDDRRWEPGLYGLPRRHGKVKDFATFDAQFFGVPPKHANATDPQLRTLLEVSYEAMLDSGTNPLELRGTRTGVFVGCSGSETMSALTRDPESVSGASVNGCAQSMFANRLSFVFDLRGPSLAVDTACNSSLLALQLAVSALRNGECTAALVCGANATLTPVAALQFSTAGVTGPDGACRSFDAQANGYAKSEGIAALLLQKRSVAHRVYCTVIHAKSNTDGYKESGISFPSVERQSELLAEVYQEAGVDPSSIAYVEAHGTGTKAGDPVETEAITKVFLKARSKPLLIGSVKSNMGHAEPASGVASMAKVIIAMESGVIPPNMHFQVANPNIPALLDGRLKVVTESTPWDGGLIGINSFGFGGANTHVLVQSFNHEQHIPRQPNIPRLLCFGGRVPEGLDVVLDAAERNSDNPHFLQLIQEQSLSPLNLFPHRGFILTNRRNGDPVRESQVTSRESRAVWFVFTGMGTQWTGMGQDLMEIDTFRKSILESSEVLRKYGTDIYALLMSTDKDTFKNVKNAIVCNLAIQLALTDLLCELGIVPDGMIGHSMGEIACGYCDGGLTRKQAILLGFRRGEAMLNAGFSPGAMAAVGLSWEAAGNRLPSTGAVVRACHNGLDSVTISGEKSAVTEIVEELEAEGVFAKPVDSSGIAFHAPCMHQIVRNLTQEFEAIIPRPKMRSQKWISSSVRSGHRSELALLCSAEYHVNNVLSPVLFYEALQEVPPNSIIIEIAPHALLQAILRRNLPQSCSNIGLMKAEHENSVEFLLSAIGKLYCAGLNPNLRAFYPPPALPVPRGTPMLSPLMRWDHSQVYPVVSESDFIGNIKIGGSVVVDPHDPDNNEYKFLLDHTIDGRLIFPFTGFPVMAWKLLCKSQGLDFNKTGVIFEELTVYRPVFLSKAVKFHIALSEGAFEVIEEDSRVASGKIQLVEEGSDRNFFYEQIEIKPNENCEFKLNPSDIYKEFRILGYEFGPEFRGIEAFNLEGTQGLLRWNGNWVTFLDTISQSALLRLKMQGLRLPLRLHYLRIDPRKHEASAITQGDKRVVPVFVEPETGGSVAGGVELRNAVTQFASRRVHDLNLFLEQISFVKHQDDQCLSQHPEIRTALKQYSDACVYVLHTLVHRWGENGLAALPNGYLLKKAFHNRTFFHDPTTTQQCLTTQQPNNALPPFLIQLGKINPESPDFSRLKDDVVNKFRADLEGDVWLKSAFGMYCLKPMLDIAVRNAQIKNCCVIEPRDSYAEQTAKWLMETHPGIQPNWVRLGPGQQDVGEGNKFDLLFLDAVLSTKMDPENYLLKLKDICYEKSFLLLYEPTDKHDIVLLIESLITGEEFSNEDDGARIFGKYFSHERILEIFRNTEYTLIGFRTDPAILGTVYLVRNITGPAPDPVFVDIDDVKDFSWVEPLQHQIEECEDEPDNKTIWLTSTVLDNGAVGLANCFRVEYGKQNRLRMIADVSLSENERQLDLESEDIKNKISEDLVQNCYRDGNWGSFVHFPVKEENSRQCDFVEHAFVHHVGRADLSSLKWIESSNAFFTPSQNQELCSVYYAGLNFRDIMLATGRLSADSIPGQFAEKDSVYGTEFTGRLPDGRRVMGLVSAQGLATSVVVNSNLNCWEIPDTWSMEEAATVLTAYFTAYHSLFIRGKLQRGESILIHSGSGGVGLAAISIALALDCQVFTTVGSKEKKEFLQDRFPQLTDRNFCNSRTLDFEWEILKRTGGKGVDMVLNSLAEQKLQASLRCLAEFGRFLEIGKVDMAQNSKIGMELLLKNITIHGIVLDGMEDGLKELWALFADGLRTGVVQPLPTTVFQIHEIEDAFRFMSSGVHVGKVVIKIRDEEAENTAPRPIQVKAIRRSYCNPESVYLITGGLGGFGMELANWLTTRGAKKLVLSSRSGVRNGYQARNLKLWEKAGISVVVSRLDVSVEAEAQQLITECLEHGPLGGVFHLAMVLRDSLFENQTVRNFQESAAAKYWGTKHLDKATREQCGPELHWFVSFSSITAGRGNSGQTAYGWANSSLERVMERRMADGLNGVAVAFGAIGDVGVIMENIGDNSSVVSSTIPQRVQSCLHVLDTLLCWNKAIVGSYVRAETGKQEHGGFGTMEAVARILGLSDISQIDPNTRLVEFGLDSLMGMEMRQAIEAGTGIVLSMKEIQNLTMNTLQNIGNPNKDLVADH